MSLTSLVMSMIFDLFYRFMHTTWKKVAVAETTTLCLSAPPFPASFLMSHRQRTISTQLIIQSNTRSCFSSRVRIIGSTQHLTPLHPRYTTKSKSVPRGIQGGVTFVMQNDRSACVNGHSVNGRTVSAYRIVIIDYVLCVCVVRVSVRACVR